MSISLSPTIFQGTEVFSFAMQFLQRKMKYITGQVLWQMVSWLFRHLCPQFILVLVHAGSKKLYLFSLFLKKTTLGHLIILMFKFCRPGLICIITFWLVNFKHIFKNNFKICVFKLTWANHLLFSSPALHWLCQRSPEINRFGICEGHKVLRKQASFL